MSFQCIQQVFLIYWQLSLTDILSEPSVPYITLWPTGWQQQTPICSYVLRTGACGKEIPVDKKLHQIREQPSQWKITLDLLYLCCKQVNTGLMPVAHIYHQMRDCTKMLKGSHVQHKCSILI